MTNTVVPDRSWSELGDLSDEECERKVAERCRRVAQLPEGEREAELHRMIVAEYDLDEPRLLKFTRCRLLAWLAMPFEEANAVARGYDAVFNQLSGSTAMRRAAVVQTVVRDFEPAQIEALHGIIPTTIAAIPALHRSDTLAAPAAEPAPVAKKKSSWRFWER
ncbi:MAG: hypothetical protein ABI782_01920 [Anaerolineaceae bacterium]